MARRFSVFRGASRIVFGAGSSARIGEEIATLGVERVLVVTTPGRKGDGAAIASRLGARGAGVLAIAREHVPAEIAAQARAEAERLSADAVLAFGGGSAIGLAKAVAVGTRARVVAVPTTYSGSEMTPIFGITDGREKKTGRDERARPALVVYDPSLTAALPRDVAIASMWNAIAHACEALWSKEPDRAIALGAEEALRLLAPALGALSRADDAGAREAALEGAYLAGAAFGDAGSGLHHKLCHVLGGAFDLPHAATHAALLPHVARFVGDAAPAAMAAIGRALGAIDPIGALARLAAETSTRGLGALGLPRDGFARVADALVASPPYSPRPLDRASATAILEAAFESPARRDAAPLRAPETLAGQPGFASTHTSEALPGALPHRANTPRPSPYGLYPELLSGTPFTVKNAQNSRVFMYRIRPSFAHDELRPIASPRFAAPLGDVDPNRTRWQPLPIPTTRTDFLDGLVTLGGAGDPANGGMGYAVHLYAANADMADRCFSNADGDVLIVPQEGTLECRTELGWLRAAPGSILVIPRGVKFSVGSRDAAMRGWMLEVFGTKLRLPERGPIGSNGMADARHFLAPVASYEDRVCPGGFEHVTKLGGRLFASTQEHSPFDVVAWHGSHVPCSYDLSLFCAMGSVTFDHPDPSILTVLTAPLDDHGRAVADFVCFAPRWVVSEKSFRPPFMHRNAASEVNAVVRTPPGGDYVAGCTFVSPLLTSHGVSTTSYDRELDRPLDQGEAPERIPDESLWIMFESALPFRATEWARTTPLVDRAFIGQFAGMKKRFDPSRPKG